MLNYHSNVIIYSATNDIEKIIKKIFKLNLLSKIIKKIPEKFNDYNYAITLFKNSINIYVEPNHIFPELKDLLSSFEWIQSNITPLYYSEELQNPFPSLNYKLKFLRQKEYKKYNQYTWPNYCFLKISLNNFNTNIPCYELILMQKYLDNLKRHIENFGELNTLLKIYPALVYWNLNENLLFY